MLTGLSQVWESVICRQTWYCSHHVLLGNLTNEEQGKGILVSTLSLSRLLRSVTRSQGSNMNCLSYLSLDSLIGTCSSLASEGLAVTWPVGGSFAPGLETFISPLLAPGFEWDFCLLSWRWSAPRAVSIGSPVAFQGRRPFVEDEMVTPFLGWPKRMEWDHILWRPLSLLKDALQVLTQPTLYHHLR